MMNNKFDEKWVFDTGLIVVLILLFLSFRSKDNIYAWAAFFVVLILIFYPKLLNPVGYLWHKAAYFLSKIFSSFFLVLTFFLIVSPIGIIRRFIGKDDLGVKNWKNSKSTFKERNYLFTKNDFEKPY